MGGQPKADCTYLTIGLFGASISLRSVSHRPDKPEGLRDISLTRC